MKYEYLAHIGYRENSGTNKGVPYANSTLKLDIWDANKGRWMTVKEQLDAEHSLSGSVVGDLIRKIRTYLAVNGLDEDNGKRLPIRKQVFLPMSKLDLAPLLRMGCFVSHYPKKYGVETDEQRAEVLVDTQQSSMHLDVSNCVRNVYLRDTNGLAFLGLKNLLAANNVPYRLYVDSSTMTMMQDEQMWGAYHYIDRLLNDHGPTRIITASPSGESVDPILLDWANRRGGHVLSRDEFDEFDRDYDWILHGAEEGHPRLHKFVRRGNQIGIPDLGLWGDIPTEWPSFPYAA